jgi:hypothetical protein
MRFDPSTSLLAGRPTAQLQADLARLQQAYIDLSSGNKGQSFSYTQGDGAKTVTYTPANIGQLVITIRQIQAQLGIIDRPRRAIPVIF